MQGTAQVPIITESPNRKGAPEKYDWAAIKLAFVEGYRDLDGVRRFPSASELAAQTGSSKTGIEARIRRECWKDQRRAFLEREAEEAAQGRAAALGRTVAEIDSLSVTAALTIVAAVQRSASQPRTPGELQALANALATATKLSRLLIGETTDNTAISTPGLILYMGGEPANEPAPMIDVTPDDAEDVAA